MAVGSSRGEDSRPENAGSTSRDKTRIKLVFGDDCKFNEQETHLNVAPRGESGGSLVGVAHSGTGRGHGHLNAGNTSNRRDISFSKSAKPLPEDNENDSDSDHVGHIKLRRSPRIERRKKRRMQNLTLKVTRRIPPNALTAER